MRTKTNPKRRTLVALFATILALAGVLALLPKVAAASEGQGGEPQLTPAVEPELTNNGNDAPANGNDNNNNNATVNNDEGGDKQLNVAEDSAKLEVSLTVVPEDSNQAFEFDIEGNDGATFEPLTGDNYVTVTGGKFTLTHGKKAGFTVQQGKTYTIKQKVLEDWKVTWPEGVSLVDNVATTTVTVSENETPVEFVDKKKEPMVLTQISSPTTITPTSTDYKTNITDMVFLFDLDPQKTYTVEGELYKASDQSATGIKAKAENVKPDENGSKDFDLVYKDVEAGKYTNDKLVSFVTVKDADGVEVCSEKDISVEEQTVTITGIGNSLTISKKILTPKTDEAIAKAQEAVDKAETEDAKKTAQDWLDDLVNHRDGNKEKSVTGAKDKEFTFTVKLTDAEGKELEGEFPLKDADGNAVKNAKDEEQKIKSGDTVKLKADESVTIADLPTGTKYEVVEEKLDNWECDQEKNTVSGEIKEGEASKADFVNTGKGSFTISKKVKAKSGSLSDDLKNTEFTFTVNFYDCKDSATRKDVEGEFAYAGSKEGTIKSGDTITLKGDEKITFDVDPGIYVRVSESTKTNWTASSKNLAGAIYDGKTRTADFTNTYSTKTASTSTKKSTTSSRAATAKTADPTTIAPLAMSAFSVALVGAGALSRKRQ